MELNLESFRVNEKDGLRLINPEHSAAASNETWTRENLWLRSRVESVKSGDTVSQGFGKFFNLGQGPDGLRIDVEDIVQAIRNGEPVVATLKHDGSCLIRSVHDGKAMFRTRGSFTYAYHDLAEEEMAKFVDHYPKLLDPTWEPTRSLLFEWMTPDFQIVIKYDEADLSLLGAVDHGQMRYLTIEELTPIANEGGMGLTQNFTIRSMQEWTTFYSSILDDQEIEGYVLRMNNEQDLVKIKSIPYITKHGIKSNLSFKNMIEFWLQHGKETTYGGIIGEIEKLYDEEIVMWALPFVENLFEAVEAWRSAFVNIEAYANERSHWARKDFAIEAQKHFSEDRSHFSIAMQVWQGNEIEDKMIRNFMMKFDKGVKGQFD
jgi:T4 RnlA family RNA ligase